MENIDQNVIPPKKTNWVLIGLVIFLLVVGSVAAIFFLYRANKFAVKSGEDTIGKIDSSKDAGNLLFNFSLVKPVFAEYTESRSNVVPAIPYQKVKFSELTNAKSFFDNESTEFSDEQKKSLENNGFYLTNNNFIGDQEWGNDDFYDTYTKFSGSSNPYFREPNNAVFVSSDYALHMYHILVDRSFQRLEETKLQPMITNITRALFENAIDNYNNTTDAKLKSSYQRLSVFYLVPLVILDAGSSTNKADDLKPEDFSNYAKYLEAVDKAAVDATSEKLNIALPDNKIYDDKVLGDEIYNLAKQELALIAESKGIAPSPLFTPWRPEFKNDYSQFTPRSHYTKNNIFKSYFMAMMWYGRSGFALNSPELTRDAIIITGQINSLQADGQPIVKLWSDFASLIDFFVGEPDDLTAFDYTVEIQKVFGNQVTGNDLINDDRINQFITQAKVDLPKPRILSEAIDMQSVDEKTKEQLLADTMQFRFMGQRFTIDAYILNKLTQGDESPDPGTGQKLPSTPTALMPISLLNSANQVVKKYLDDWINDPARIAKEQRQSDKIIAKVYGQLQVEIAAFSDNVWTQNIYWSWLNCLRPLLASYGQGYPAFMIGDAWQKKNLGTSLGAYTEIKHDTLLYAKQSYAERGGGGDNPTEMPPAVKGYVEPDLVFWNRIIALAEKTKQGLTARNVMPDEFGDRYDAFINASKFYQQIVEQELKNEKISDEDFEKLRTINSDLEIIFAPLAGQTLMPKDRRAGIIADIHTNVPLSEILYESTGKPYVVYVAIKDANGTRLTHGAVFNHYEFTDKLDGRLTDENWQAKVYLGKGALPATDKWSQDLLKK